MPIPYPPEPTADPHFTIAEQVNILPPLGDAIDISSRLLTYRINASLDNATTTASFTFARGGGTDSLSPLIGGSVYRFGDGRPALDPGLRLVMHIGINGTPAVSPFDAPFFDGRVDRIDAAGPGTVTVTCRDRGGYYLNAVIPEARWYGTPSGQEASLVMRQILVDNGFSDGDLALRAPADFFVQEFPQEEMTVLEALRRIAQQAGRDVRTQANGDGLIYYDPDRTRTSPDDIIGADRYEDITELAWGDEDVRNAWRLSWRGEDGLPQGPVEAEDVDSILRYGRRNARFFIDRVELIRSEAAATAMLAAVLADSKDPLVSHAIRLPFWPRVLLNDLHLYEANGVEYDEDQLLAVAAYTHEKHATGHVTTTIGARGKPIAAYREYRRSIAPKTLAVTAAPTEEYAPEGTLAIVVRSLARVS